MHNYNDNGNLPPGFNEDSFEPSLKIPPSKMRLIIEEENRKKEEWRKYKERCEVDRLCALAKNESSTLRRWEDYEE